MKKILFVSMILSVSSAALAEKYECQGETENVSYELDVNARSFPEADVVLTRTTEAGPKTWNLVGKYTQTYDMDTGKKYYGFFISLKGNPYATSEYIHLENEMGTNASSARLNSPELTGSTKTFKLPCHLVIE